MTGLMTLTRANTAPLRDDVLWTPDQLRRGHEGGYPPS